MAKRILIVGGGTGGTMVANFLARGLAQEIRSGRAEIALVSDTDRHIYQPGLLYLAFGRMSEEELFRDERSLLDPSISFVVDPAVEIDAGRQIVRTLSGKKMPFDYLVLATGSRLDPQAVPGLAGGGHWFYDLEGARKLRDSLRGFGGGRIVITVGVPHKCPVAPLEAVFMLHDHLVQRGIRDKADLFYTYPIGRLHNLEPIAEWAVPEFEKKGIRWETFFNMESIDPAKKTLTSMEGSTVEYDLLIAIPPHLGQPVIADSGIAKDGWVPTDRRRLIFEGHENVFVVGDTTNIPVSKAGSTAHFEAEVVAQNLISEIRSGASGYFYDGKVFCFIETGLDRATHVWFDYATPPRPSAPSKTIHWFKLAYNRLYWLNARGIL